MLVPTLESEAEVKVTWLATVVGGMEGELTPPTIVGSSVQ